jgi:hypothetical protein
MATVSTAAWTAEEVAARSRDPYSHLAWNEPDLAAGWWAIAPLTSTITAGTLSLTASIAAEWEADAGGVPHGVIRRRGRARQWDNVPEELAPVVALAEDFAAAAEVQRAVDDALLRFARIGARTSAARRHTLIDEMRRAVVAAVERAAEDDDEDALTALL